MKVAGGQYRGRRIRGPAGAATRPTSGKVREALFAILGPLDESVVLDLFAGSGALGIEALSRGARRAVFVDDDSEAIRAVEGNLRAMGILSDQRVQQIDAPTFLRNARSQGHHYDLVFVDPPYRQAAEFGAGLSQLLVPVLAPAARVISESDRRQPLELDLPVADERRYGDTLIRIHGHL